MNPCLLRITGVSFILFTSFTAFTVLAGTGGLFFDGGNDRVTFGAAPSLGVTNFTVECWFKRTGAGVTTTTGTGGTTAVPLVTKGRGEAENSNVDMNWFLGFTSAGVLTADFEDRNGGTNHPVTGTTAASSNIWQHAAMTYDQPSGTWVLYLNGQPDKTNVVVGIDSTRTPRGDSIQHGALASALTSSGAAAGFFAGMMDEVRVWNYARTNTEIAAAYNTQITSAPGLIARWSLDDGTGSTATNSVSGGVNGTLANGPVWTNGYFVSASVSITSPTNGGTVIGDWSALAATAFPSTGATITNVQFYADAIKIGDDTSVPYTLTWCDVAPATYSLTTVVQDDSGATATSSVVSVTVSAPLATGSLEFDGTNDYVTFGPAPELGLSAFTLECWFKRKGTGVITTTGTGGISNAIPLVTKGRGEAEGSNVDMNWFFGISTNGNVLAADFEEGATGSSPGLNHPVFGSTPVENDVWNHAAATYDGTNWTLYLNGNVETNLAVGQPPRSDSIQHAALASAQTSTGTPAGYFRGVMDEVRIWNYARSGTEISDNLNLQITNQAGLIARWALNDGSGGLIRNAICGGVNGNLTNGAAWSTDYFDINIAPSVSITNPLNSAVILGATVTIEATASDTDGSVTNVQFYSGATPLGDDATEPYSFVWNGVTPGAYALTAVASDDLGLSATSAVVNVTVTPIVPSVSITNPVDNDVISATNVTIEAMASDMDGSVTNVQFYSANTLLADDTTEPYSFIWNDVYPGTYALRAVATDDLGYSTTSAVVNVTVTPPPGVGGLYFKGKSDYVTFGEAAGLGVTNFTIECWFKQQGAGKRANTGTGGIRAYPLVTKGQGENENGVTNMNYFFGIGTNNSGEAVLAADFEDMAGGTNRPVRGNSVVTNNMWQHGAVTYDVASGTWTLYLNGDPDATNVLPNVDLELLPRFDSIQHAALGASLQTGGKTNADTGFFAGTMDEVRIWNVVRTETEIANSYQTQITSASGLIARWSLDDAAGLTATNSGSSAVDGTLTNGPVWVDGYPFVTAPSITNQPQSQSVECGDNVLLTVGASGAAPLFYQWYFETNSILNETNETLSMTGVSGTNDGYYFVIVQNAGGSATSSVATVTVSDTTLPVISVCATNMTLSADINCQAILPDLTSQISASDSCSSVTVAQSPLAGTVVSLGDQVVTITVEDTSTNQAFCYATVTVADTNAPVVTAEPQSITNVVGTTAMFTVTATSCSPIGYQWLYESGPLGGEVASTLTITNVQPGSAGNYSVLLTNAAGSITSAVAVLTVQLPIPPTVSSGPMILVNGHFYVGFTGTPNVPYSVECATNITGPWEILTNMTTDLSGFMGVEDFTTPRPSMRFYRAVYP